jgi:hypothetical protein
VEKSFKKIKGVFMKLSDVMNPEFGSAFNKVMASKLNGKIAFRLVKLMKQIQKDSEIYEEIRMTTLENLADKDENRQPIIQDGKYQLSEDKLAFLELKLKELRNVEIEFEKFSIDDFDSVELTANEMFAISGILAD